MGKRHGVRWFAALYDPFMQPIERRLLGPLRRRLVADLHGDVLEIGAGTGANFPLYAEQPAIAGGIYLTAAEPDDYMADRARQRAASLGLPVTLVAAPAETLPYPDASFDVVIATLVLCTVDDPVRSLAEVRRVLRPGGEFRFLEHVRAPGLGGLLQDGLRPAWAVIGAGCQLNRSTGEMLAQSGFEDVTYEEVDAPFPILRLLIGRATVR
jgi:ubiquinone/menaquinone biosynthesis C-methylase UbiE